MYFLCEYGIYFYALANKLLFNYFLTSMAE